MKRFRRLTIKTKIMLLYAVLSAALLAVLIPFLFYILSETLKDSLKTNVETSAGNIVGYIYESGGDIYVDEDEITPETIGAGIYIRVCFGDEIIYESPDADWAFEEYENRKRENTIRSSWAYYLLESEVLGSRETVYIYAVGNVYYSSFLEDFALILLIIAAIFLLVSILGSRFIVSRALWPVKVITKTAASVSVNDPSKRIENIESKDEIGELAKTFNVMLDDIESSFKRERQFTSDVSHELRTPITVIETCADEALKTENPEIIKENLDIIKKENDRMAKMISQLLFLSRGYEGRLNFEPEEFILFDLVQSVVDVMEVKASEKSITIYNEVNEDLVIKADQSLITQLFVNLIDNAIKYGKENGWVRIDALNKDGRVQILIKDNGAGIAKDKLDHIFERFYRADQARDRSGQGLGLSIVKQIVDLHGGEIIAFSEEGKGTTFCIELS